MQNLFASLFLVIFFTSAIGFYSLWIAGKYLSESKFLNESIHKKKTIVFSYNQKEYSKLHIEKSFFNEFSEIVINGDYYDIHSIVFKHNKVNITCTKDKFELQINKLLELVNSKGNWAPKINVFPIFFFNCLPFSNIEIPNTLLSISKMKQIVFPKIGSLTTYYSSFFIPPKR